MRRARVELLAKWAEDTLATAIEDGELTQSQMALIAELTGVGRSKGEEQAVSAERMAACDDYWAAKTPMEEREAHARMIAFGLPGGYQMNPPRREPLQDGLLAFYLSCASSSDVNVERRVEAEVFDYIDYSSEEYRVSRIADEKFAAWVKERRWRDGY